jgi:GWxTD domain-containing protein
VPIEAGRFSRGGVVLGKLALYRVRDRSTPVPTEFEVLESGLPDPDLFARRNSGSFDFATGDPWVLLRIFDLRKDPPEGQLALRLTVLPEGDEVPRWERDLEVDRAGYETSVLLVLPAEAFAFGRNRVELRRDGSEPVQTYVENLGLDLRDAESWRANVRQIRVLATEEEFDALEHAPPDQRLPLWEKFWAERDPDPETPENERLDIHYQRVAYARAFLRDGFSDGALSDRGQIWILHGRPDVIDSSTPGFENYGTYEVWRYTELRLVYYFRDTDGLGRYRLVWQEGI